MKKIYSISILLLIAAFASCKKDKKANENPSEKVIDKEVSTSNETNQVKAAPNNHIKKFSWDDIPKSTHDIGAYPYITPPKGMVVNNNTSNTESYDFHKLIMFDGNSFFDIEGRVEKIGIMMENDKDWNQYYFDKSVKDYLNSIGAKLIFEGKIPNEIVYKKEETETDLYQFFIGSILNDPIRMYVLNTPNKKIGIQVHSSIANGQIGIVESKQFEQTIEKITADKILDQIKTNGFATLHINFDTGKSRIKSESYEIVNEIVKMMKTNPDLKISIEGHTDNVGDEASNMKLSKNRAKAVLMALVDEDIEESRLKSEGFGQTKPIGDNNTEEGKAQNRRVELRKI